MLREVVEEQKRREIKGLGDMKKSREQRSVICLVLVSLSLSSISQPSLWGFVCPGHVLCNSLSPTAFETLDTESRAI